MRCALKISHSPLDACTFGVAVVVCCALAWLFLKCAKATRREHEAKLDAAAAAATVTASPSLLLLVLLLLLLLVGLLLLLRSPHKKCGIWNLRVLLLHTNARMHTETHTHTYAPTLTSTHDSRDFLVVVGACKLEQKVLCDVSSAAHVNIDFLLLTEGVTERGREKQKRIGGQMQTCPLYDNLFVVVRPAVGDVVTE